MSEGEGKQDKAAVEKLQRLVRVRTVSGEAVVSGAYSAAAAILQEMMMEEGMSVEVVVYNNKPVVLGTLLGAEPSLPAVLLSGHYDVVPVSAENWTVDPFSAYFDSSSNRIYGRGTQDMKGVLVQYMQAISSLRKQIPFKDRRRTIHLTCLPDEEVGGKEGMAQFLKSDVFSKLNIGVCFDEGIPSPEKSIRVYTGERAVWWVKISAKGETGHASRFVTDDLAVNRLMRSIRHFMQFRESEAQRMKNQGLDIGEITTINITSLSANPQTNAFNVIPNYVEAVFDIRLPPEVNVSQFEELIQKWTDLEGCSYEKLVWSPKNCRTDVSEGGDGHKWWKIIQEAFSEPSNFWSLEMKPFTLPVATDARYIRNIGIPCFGMSAFGETPLLLHDHDEYVSVEALNEGIQVYLRILKRIVTIC